MKKENLKNNKTYEYKLHINDQDYFLITSQDIPISEVSFHFLDISLIVKNITYYIAQEDACSLLDDFITFSNFIKNNTLYLDTSITNIGKQYLEHNALFWLQENTGIKQPELKYLFLQTAAKTIPNLNIWLYQNNKNEHILEVTPGYNFNAHLDNPEQYQTFIKFYASLSKAVINTSIWLSWFETITTWRNQITKNYYDE